MSEAHSPVHWYIGVSQAGRMNFERALQSKTWGAKVRKHFTDTNGEIQQGDIVHFIVSPQWAGVGPAPKGFPRVELEQYIVQGPETAVRVTSPLFEADERIWDDDVYPARFRFDVISENKNIHIAPHEVSDDVRNAVRVSLISQSKAVRITSALTSINKAIVDVLHQYMEARQRPFPDHPVTTVVKSDIPLALREWGALPEDRYKIIASVGQGNWAAVPWVAIVDKHRGGTIQDGLYVALLFSQDMRYVVLALMYGVSGARAKDRSILEADVQNLRQHLKFQAETWILDSVHLADRGVGAQYGRGIVLYREFSRDAIPSDIEWQNQFSSMIEVYNEALNMVQEQKSRDNPGLQAPVSSARENFSTYGTRPFDLVQMTNMITAMGYQISMENVLNVMLSLEVRPFVIFSGRSGTGKTTLARILATLFGFSYHMVAVSPAWADPADLLGFVSPLNNERMPGALEPLLSANRPSLLCLDEFNVAKVEHYFSDFISAMDSGRKNFWGTLPSLGRLNDPELSLPPNLCVVATMNFDDSVQSITPRVLDRANVVEFELSSAEQLVVDQSLDWDRLGDLVPFQWPWRTVGVVENTATSTMVRQLWQWLKGSRGQFGHRVAQEMHRYVELGLPFAQNFSRSEESQNEALFDRQIVQRLLPKFHGTASSSDIAALIRVLGGLMGLNDVSDGAGERQRLLEDAKNRGQYPLTVEKIDKLIRTYTEDGYAAFW